MASGHGQLRQQVVEVASNSFASPFGRGIELMINGQASDQRDALGASRRSAAMLQKGFCDAAGNIGVDHVCERVLTVSVRRVIFTVPKVTMLSRSPGSPAVKMRCLREKSTNTN